MGVGREKTTLILGWLLWGESGLVAFEFEGGPLAAFPGEDVHEPFFHVGDFR